MIALAKNIVNQTALTQALSGMTPCSSNTGSYFKARRIVGLICLSSGGLMNAAVGTFSGKGSGEQTLLRSLLDSLEPNDVLLGDAYFGTYIFVI